jgi:hypothetical protein
MRSIIPCTVGLGFSFYRVHNTLLVKATEMSPRARGGGIAIFDLLVPGAGTGGGGDGPLSVTGFVARSAPGRARPIDRRFHDRKISVEVALFNILGVRI